MKYLKIVYFILGILPFGFIISLLTFYFHAGNILGRLPSYNHPDPKDFSIYLSYSPLINLTLEVCVYSFFPWLVLILVDSVLYWKNISWRLLLGDSLGYGIILFLLFSGIIDWYMD
jgi:hypothetical protein